MKMHQPLTSLIQHKGVWFSNKCYDESYNNNLLITSQQQEITNKLERDSKLVSTN